MIQSISTRCEAELHRETMQTKLVYGAARHRQLAVGSSGRIRAFALRARGVSGSIPGTALVVALC